MLRCIAARIHCLNLLLPAVANMRYCVKPDIKLDERENCFVLLSVMQEEEVQLRTRPCSSSILGIASLLLQVQPVLMNNPCFHSQNTSKQDFFANSLTRARCFSFLPVRQASYCTVKEVEGCLEDMEGKENSLSGNKSKSVYKGFCICSQCQ